MKCKDMEKMIGRDFLHYKIIEKLGSDGRDFLVHKKVIITKTKQ